MKKVKFKSVYSVIAFFLVAYYLIAFILFLDYVSFNGKALITHFEHLWHDKKDICEVRLPSEHLVVDLNTPRTSSNRKRTTWVMPNINASISTAFLQELVVLESGSAISDIGKVTYVKSGGTVSSNGKARSVERIFYEEGAVLYVDALIPKTRCGEIKVLNALPSNPKFPDQRTVDIRGPRGSVVNFKNRRVINNQILMIPESDTSLCIEGISWVGEGLFSYGRRNARQNFRAKVQLIDSNGQVLGEEQVGFHSDLMYRFSRHLQFDENKTIRLSRGFRKVPCFNDVSEPGSYKIQVHLDAFNDIEETDETNNIFSYNFQVVN